MFYCMLYKWNISIEAYLQLNEAAVENVFHIFP